MNIQSLNYHHLRAFWAVAREGGLVPAGRFLHVTHSTLSAQIHALEAELGEPLLQKAGRRLALTDAGKLVLRYTEEIFSLGRELVESVQGKSSEGLRLVVGIADVLPKLVVRGLLQPALALDVPVRLVCHEDAHDRLLGQLAQHDLDIVLSDSPVAPGSSVRVFNHRLGDTPVAIYGTPELVRRYRAGFPRSLDGAPLLLPLEALPLRRALNQWLARRGIRPRVVGEFEDSALMKVFGADGLGLFAAPVIMRKAIAKQYGAAPLGLAEGVRETYYAISAERRLRHPAVVAISDAAHVLLR